MSENIEAKVITAYSEGSPITLIAESFVMKERLVKDILLKFKEASRYKKTFTDEFKIMIAQRDMNGGKDITRASIANDLEINANTVKKSCEQFGQAMKEKATSDKAFTKISGEFSMSKCPSCGSKMNNLVDDSTTYCMNCDSEHEYYEGYVLKINYEYLEE